MMKDNTTEKILGQSEANPSSKQNAFYKEQEKATTNLEKQTKKKDILS